MIASAAGSTEPPRSDDAAAGSAASIGSTGRRQPMTPVDDGRTSPGAQPTSRAASAHTRSAASTPPGAQTFAILLFTTRAASAGPSARRRPTITGAPGNAFRVNLAAKAGVGRSSATSVSRMRAGFGTSTGTNSNDAVPTRKPSG